MEKDCVDYIIFNIIYLTVKLIFIEVYNLIWTFGIKYKVRTFIRR